MQATAEEKIEFRMTMTVGLILGWSDWMGYVVPTYPSVEELRGGRYRASRSDIDAILESIADRIAEGRDYGCSPSDVRVLRIAAKNLRAALKSTES